MPRVPPPVAVLLACAAVALAAYPSFGDAFYVRLVAHIMVIGIFVMSLDLLVGFTGLVSLGHAAYFGVAGYVTAAMIVKGGHSDMLVILPAALAAAAAAALVIGWISIRTSGIYFIMITLALAQMVYFFFHDIPFWGGADGINIPRRKLPKLEIGDTVLLDFSDREVFYYTALGCLVGAYLLLWVLLRSPFGRVIVGIRANEGRVRALGYDVARYKLVAFVIAGTLAGLAGFLEASRTAFIAPAHLSWHESGLALVMVLLGGMGTLFGPVIGAFVLLLARDLVSEITERWQLWMGLFVIANVLFLPNGIAGLLLRLFRPPARKAEDEQAPAARPAVAGEGAGDA